MIYLDNNATTEPLPEVRAAVLAALQIGPSNPSSSHAAGEPARRLLADAREHVARLIGAASPEQIVFTGSGTEANNIALRSLIASRPPSHLLITPVEHESIRRTAEMLEASGVTVSKLPLDESGRICLEAAEQLITSEIDLVSVQWVSNETGIVQPVEQVATICRDQGVCFHTDAAQAVGKMSVDVSSLAPDMLSFTGHKIHGPMGVGVLYVRERLSLPPILGGGTQEFGIRPGSHNLAGIAGLATACQLRRERLNAVMEHMRQLRDVFEQRLIETCEEAQINTLPDVIRICNTTNIRFPGVDGEALLAQILGQDICCSQGSACTAQIPEPSHTLLAMGLSVDQAYQSIRFSFSELNTMAEVDEAVETISTCYANLKCRFDRLHRTIAL